MNVSSFKNVRVKGIVTVMPETHKLIDDEAELFGYNPSQLQRIKSVIGINKRHITSQQTTTADLCEHAARKLMDGLKMSFFEIDALILVTQTPDYLQPYSAAVLHGKLDLPLNCATFDVNHGCTGYLYGLWLASLMIENGGMQNVLVLAGDTPTKHIYEKDKALAPLFGDGGSATLLSNGQSNSYYSFHTNGKEFDKLIIPAGGYRTPRTTSTNEIITDEEGNSRSQEHLYMNGGEIFNFSISVVPDAINKFLQNLKIEKQEIDYFVLHQANRFILKNIGRVLKVPEEKIPSETFSEFGNQSTASIPSVICHELSKQATSSDLKLLLCGFGIGISWGCTYVETSNIYCPPVQFLSS